MQTAWHYELTATCELLALLALCDAYKRLA